MLISVAHVALSFRSMLASTVSRNALIGLASGTAFGVSAVAYRAASLSLGGPNFMMQAAVTLAFVIAFQTAIMLLWMLWKDRAEIGRIAKAWKLSLFTGFVGASASFGWFTAMTIQQAAVVKSLAQIEMIFTFAASVFFFKERINRLEVRRLRADRRRHPRAARRRVASGLIAGRLDLRRPDLDQDLKAAAEARRRLRGVDRPVLERFIWHKLQANFALTPH